MSSLCHVAWVSCSIFSIIRKESEGRLHLSSQHWVWLGGVTVTAVAPSVFLHNCVRLDTRCAGKDSSSSPYCRLFLPSLSSQFLKMTQPFQQPNLSLQDFDDMQQTSHSLSNPVSWRLKIKWKWLETGSKVVFSPRYARAGTNKLKCQFYPPTRLTLDQNLHQSGKFKCNFEP